ncbi:MAG TPA: metalloregulator ArsR/SmtB family transcription factor [Candidatus Eisenbacteria bacterium]|nr:metalloregulator ArsR/SmtB family transcription factor [Candidatus Eisenbacteria bacterium]
MSPSPTAPARGGKRGARSEATAKDLDLARLAKALGHPARVAILKFLSASGECQCGSIVDQLPLAQATVSQHLKVLKGAGLVRGTIDPPRVCYCVNPEAVQRLKTLVEEL